MGELFSGGPTPNSTTLRDSTGLRFLHLVAGGGVVFGAVLDRG